MRIIVCNSRAISEYLGFEVETFDDLMTNSKCKKFVEENMDYLLSVDTKDLIEFYKKTGIILEHKLKRKGFCNNYINFLGLLSYFYVPNGTHLGPFDPIRKVFNAHLIVYDDENIIEEKNGVLYLNDKKVRDLKQELTNQEDRYNKFKEINERLLEIHDTPGYYNDFEIEKRDLILYREFKDNYPDYKEKENTEQLVISPYNDIFTLTGDGVVYCNNDVYTKNVEYIFEQDTINKIMIYENNAIEYITASFGSPLYQKFDKVLYGKTFLATLKNKKVHIISKEYDDYIVEQNYNFDLEGIDDIEYNGDTELILKVGNRNIIYDVF